MRIFTVSDREDVFYQNLGKSRILQYHDFQRICLTTIAGIPFDINASTLSRTQQKSLRREMVPIRMFVHDDVFIPDDFESQLTKAIYQLPPDWAILGVAGATMKGSDRDYTGWVLDRGRVFGSPFSSPVKTQTVDELLIILNDSHGDWRFDEQFPFDFYGADICMQAHEKGLGVYVVPAFVHHNSSRPVGGRTPSFYESEAKFKEKWKHRLPIATTCSILR